MKGHKGGGPYLSICHMEAQNNMVEVQKEVGLAIEIHIEVQVSPMESHAIIFMQDARKSWEVEKIGSCKMQNGGEFFKHNREEKRNMSYG